MATFYKCKDTDIPLIEPECPTYEECGNHRFIVDYQNNEDTDYKKILDDIICTLHWCAYNHPEYIKSDYLTINIGYIRKNMKKYFPSDDLIISLLDEDGWKVYTNNSRCTYTQPYVLCPKDSIELDFGDEKSISSNSDFSTDELLN